MIFAPLEWTARHLLIDVGVTAVKYDRELICYPSEQEVQIAIDTQRARSFSTK